MSIDTIDSENTTKSASDATPRKGGRKRSNKAKAGKKAKGTRQAAAKPKLERPKKVRIPGDGERDSGVNVKSVPG